MKYAIARSSAPFDQAVLIAAVEATGRPSVALRFEPSGVPGECFANVNRQVSEFGGRAVVGWSMLNFKYSIPGLEQAGRLAGVRLDLRGIRGTELETHCVWESPQGQFVDITPTEGGEKCRFVVDPRVPPVGLHVVVFGKREDRARYIENMLALNPHERDDDFRLYQVQ